MNFSLYIARRYLFSKSSNNAINIITIIAAIGVFAGAFSLFIVLSGFSGLKDFSLSFSNEFDPDLKVFPETGKTFVLTEDEIARLERKGFVLINHKPKPGADNKIVAFLHPKSAKGVLVELCQDTGPTRKELFDEGLR